MSWLVEIKVLDPSDSSLKAYFSNRVGGGAAIHELEYSMSRIGGCGDLELVASRDRASGHSVALGDLIEVWLQTDTEAIDKKFSGTVTIIDTDYEAGTVEIKANGYFAQFAANVVNLFLEETAVDDVVSAIFDAIKAQTYCNTTASISIASPAAIGDIEIDFQSANDVLEKLADLQGDVDYGVDEDGVFYFRDRTTTKRGHYQVGRNLAGLRSTSRADKIVNDIFIKTRNLVSDGNLIMHEADATSIAAYKKRTKVINAPEFHEASDAIAYGEAYVARNKDAATVYEFEPMIAAGTYHPYTGTVELVDEDGTSLGTMDIESVEYTYDDNGFRQKLEVGNIGAGMGIGSTFAEIDHKVRMLEAGNISASKIDHSGYDEFRQYVQQNATSTGRYNIWTTRFEEGATGKNVWEEPELSGFLGFVRSRTLRERGVRHTIPASDQPAVLQTIPIETGRVIDTLRVYHMQDIYGRNIFNSDASLEDWWNYDCSDDSLGGYMIDVDAGTDGRGALVGNPALTLANRGMLKIRPTNWANEYLNGNSSPASYEQSSATEYCAFRADNFAADNNGDAPLVIRFDTATAGTGERAELSLVRVSATTMKVLLKTYDSGNTLVDSDETAAMSNNDLIIMFRINYTTGVCEVLVYDIFMVIIDTLSADRDAGTSTTGSHYVYIKEMWNSNSADTGHIEIKWWEIWRGVVYDTPGCDLLVSRDGGTTWESNQLNNTTTPQYTDYDLSGQGSGTEIILKATFYWPCLLYGVGFAWSGD
jgi:hypothetical protein